jgi:hypothetical protein
MTTLRVLWTRLNSWLGQMPLLALLLTSSVIVAMLDAPAGLSA